MGKSNLYQPTDEELEALWEKGSRRDNPCERPECRECRDLKLRRLTALNRIIEHAQAHQLLHLKTVQCLFCKEQVPSSTAHLYRDKWVGDCCWDERLRVTA